MLLTMAMFAGPANAALDLRVESRPIADPINAYVTVTDAAGNPVGGLTAGSFTVTLDGAAVASPEFSLPPSANPDRNVSVVFVMDFSPSTTGDPRGSMQQAVVDFINSMGTGDYAAIVKFNGSSGASVVRSFTQTDVDGKAALVSAAMLDYNGSYTNLYDGIDAALNHLAAPGVALPAGPKALVVISDGVDNASINTRDAVIAEASSLGAPLFTIGVGNSGSTGSNNMNALAARTGGNYISAPNQAAVTEAYETIASRLDNGYLLSFASTISDCNQHTLSVTVAGHGTTETRFTRCDATTGSVNVPDVRNMTQSAAGSAITGAGLVVGIVTQQHHATVPAGRVSSQNPTAGVGVATGSAVNFVVSIGPEPTPGMVNVPNVVNQTQTAATTALTGVGLVVGTVSQQSSTTVAAGSVISHTPTAGTSVATGSAVSLVVSTGPVAVPNVVNMTQSAATTALTAAGLALGAVSSSSHASVPSGSVISQNPAAGTNVAAGSAVALVVSTGPAAQPNPPSNGGGGGGSTGLGGLALGLAAMLARRRKRA